MSEFSTLAPRLHKAHHQTQMQAISDDVARRKHQDEFTRLEKLIVHRDLQLVRAFYTDDKRYIHKRSLLLDEAKNAKRRLLRKGPAYRDLFA